MSITTTAPLTTTEIDRLRSETPGCAHVVHFNHAGASLMPRRVIDATVGHIHREAEIGGYEAAGEAHARLEAVYGSIARLIGANPDEIAVVENATRAWDMAFYAIPLEPGDRILTTTAEYSSNVIAALQVAKQGVTLEVVPADGSGQIDLAALDRMMDQRVKIVAVSHMPTNGGLLQPAASIGRVVQKWSAVYILDACQTVGQLPVDVAEIGCDVLSATSRKYLRGPRGMGFLYVRRPVLERLVPPFLDNHAAHWVARDRYEIRPDARRFENWEANIAAKLGMGAAVDEALAIGLDRIWTTIRPLAASLRARLSAIRGVTVQDIGQEQGGIVTFTLDGHDPEAVVAHLAERRINVNTSSRASTRYDMEDRGLDMVVRASLHCFTTEEEIDKFCTEIERLAT